MDINIEYVILSKIIPGIVIDENGCWLNNRKTNKGTYQRAKINDKRVQSHVLAASLFLDFNKESKLYVCHKCDIPACFNPNHLFIGTSNDNSYDHYRKQNLKSVQEKLLLDYNIIILAPSDINYRDREYSVEDFIEMNAEDEICH